MCLYIFSCICPCPFFFPSSPSSCSPSSSSSLLLYCIFTQYLYFSFASTLHCHFSLHSPSHIFQPHSFLILLYSITFTSIPSSPHSFCSHSFFLSFLTALLVFLLFLQPCPSILLLTEHLFLLLLFLSNPWGRGTLGSKLWS